MKKKKNDCRVVSEEEMKSSEQDWQQGTALGIIMMPISLKYSSEF